MKTRHKKTISLILLVLILAACAVYQDGTRVQHATLMEKHMALHDSPQYSNGTFHNPTGARPTIQNGWFTMLRRYVLGAEERNPAKTPPSRKPNMTDFTAPTDSVRVIWISHSTVLLNVEGSVILTDPVFAQAVSPLPLLGPSRFNPKLAIGIDELPDIDVVLLSHDHYDHLDKTSILALLPKTAQFIAPLGVDGHLLRWGVPEEKITVLDWWGHTTASGLSFHALPAQHFSGRGLLDRNTTLWASWAILGSHSRVFFGGDTGYHAEFKAIGEQLGPFDLALLECGAYSEHWPDIHMQPEDTARAYHNLDAKVLMPIHWATFNLALHDWFEPIQRLLAAAGPHADIATPMQGEMFELAGKLPTTPWWRKALSTSKAPAAHDKTEKPRLRINDHLDGRIK